MVNIKMGECSVCQDFVDGVKSKRTNTQCAEQQNVRTNLIFTCNSE